MKLLSKEQYLAIIAPSNEHYLASNRETIMETVFHYGYSDFFIKDRHSP